MPQDVFRKEMEYLGIYAQGVFVAAVWVQWQGASKHAP